MLLVWILDLTGTKTGSSLKHLYAEEKIFILIFIQVCFRVHTLPHFSYSDSLPFIDHDDYNITFLRMKIIFQNVYIKFLE